MGHSRHDCCALAVREAETLNILYDTEWDCVQTHYCEKLDL